MVYPEVLAPMRNDPSQMGNSNPPKKFFFLVRSLYMQLATVGDEAIMVGDLFPAIPGYL